MKKSWNRRDVLKAGAFGSAALLLPLERIASAGTASRLASSKIPRPFSGATFSTGVDNLPRFAPPVAKPVAYQSSRPVYEMTMKQISAEILPGIQTKLFGYAGSVPGPTIECTKGTPIMVRHRNGLLGSDIRTFGGYTPWTSVHLHGSASMPQWDGYASDITDPDCYKDYHYPNIQQARTLWYHDHGVHHTAQNAYMGLAGMYIMHDEMERALDIPQGGFTGADAVLNQYDVPLVVRDALFAESGNLMWDDSSGSGVWGDVILVNGKPWPKLKVEPRKYRFRILNGSISRSFKWFLDNGQPFTIIAGDGGLAEKPINVGSFRQSPGERYEVIIDFAKYAGKTITLRNTSPVNNRDYDHTGQIMQFVVGNAVSDTRRNSIPATLNSRPWVMKLGGTYDELKARPVDRTMEFIRTNSTWTVNGQTWKDVEDSDFRKVLGDRPVKLNSEEVWEIKNPSGGWFHPVHIHLIDFRIFQRNGQPNTMAHEQLPKDTIYLGENETVRIVAKFGPNAGRYMVHCHNLSHEDSDMMIQYEVDEQYPDGSWHHFGRPRSEDDCDPILAAPERNDHPLPLSDYCPPDIFPEDIGVRPWD